MFGSSILSNGDGDNWEKTCIETFKKIFPEIKYFPAVFLKILRLNIIDDISTNEMFGSSILSNGDGDNWILSKNMHNNF